MDTAARLKVTRVIGIGARRPMQLYGSLDIRYDRVDDLAIHGILNCSPSNRSLAEKAPGAYKDVTAVVMAGEQAGLAAASRGCVPIIRIKG